jgi:peptide/nickel transport system ATP-binding protein
MKQRVAIAMALSSNPKILIADEPTTALDTITQASILQLMRSLRKQGRIRDIIFISHDVTVHAYMTDRLVVMLGGRKIEEGRTKDVITKPLHPYSKLIMSSIRIGVEKERVQVGTSQLSLSDDSCPYVPFCPYAMKVCSQSFPETTVTSEGQSVACFLYGDKK